MSPPTIQKHDSQAIKRAKLKKVIVIASALAAQAAISTSLPFLFREKPRRIPTWVAKDRPGIQEPLKKKHDGGKQEGLRVKQKTSELSPKSRNEGHLAHSRHASVEEEQKKLVAEDCSGGGGSKSKVETRVLRKTRKVQYK